MIRVAILTIRGESVGDEEELSGRAIEEIIKEIAGKKVYYRVIPAQFNKIQEELFNISERGIADMILTTGGTGFAKRDITPEATLAVIEKEAPGLTEMMRWKVGQDMPKAFLSRERAGIRKNTLILNLPGKPEEVEECLKAVLPILARGIDILRGAFPQ